MKGMGVIPTGNQKQTGQCFRRLRTGSELRGISQTIGGLMIGQEISRHMRQVWNGSVAFPADQQNSLDWQFQGNKKPRKAGFFIEQRMLI